MLIMYTLALHAQLIVKDLVSQLPPECDKIRHRDITLGIIVAWYHGILPTIAGLRSFGVPVYYPYLP